MVYLLHFNNRYKHAGPLPGQHLRPRGASRAPCGGPGCALAARRAGRGHHLVPGAHLAGRQNERTPAQEATRGQPLLPHPQGGTPCCTSLNIATPATGPSGKATSCSASRSIKKGHAPSSGASSNSASVSHHPWYVVSDRCVVPQPLTTIIWLPTPPSPYRASQQVCHHLLALDHLHLSRRRT